MEQRPWALRFLSHFRNPASQDRFYPKICKALEKYNSELMFVVLNGIKYLENVFSNALRLHKSYTGIIHQEFRPSLLAWNSISSWLDFSLLSIIFDKMGYIVHPHANAATSNQFQPVFCSVEIHMICIGKKSWNFQYNLNFLRRYQTIV